MIVGVTLYSPTLEPVPFLSGGTSNGLGAVPKVRISAAGVADDASHTSIGVITLLS